MATDYDCWHSSEDVDVSMVMGHMKANGENAKRLIAAVLDRLCADDQEIKDVREGKHFEGSVRSMLGFMTKKEGRGEEGMKAVEFLYPGVWD